jgi:hypothetical protein
MQSRSLALEGQRILKWGPVPPRRLAHRGSRNLTTARALPLTLPEESTKIAIFVEPSPFSHVSGMKIRFMNLIKGLRELGNDVTVVTPCVNPPKQFCGAKVGSRGECPSF